MAFISASINMNNFEQGELEWMELRDVLPEGFKEGESKHDGDCFFDAVAQGLRQIRPEELIGVEILRGICKKHAKNHINEDSWLQNALKAMNEKLDKYILHIEITAREIEHGSKLAIKLKLNEPLLGRPDIEGRVICEEYNVKLHAIEKIKLEDGKESWTHTLIESTSCESIKKDNIDYNDKNIVHIVKEGQDYFKPVLDESNTDLHDAVLREHLKDLRKLLTENVNINAQNKDGHTPLHLAVLKIHLNIVQLLLMKGADVNIKNCDGNTALHLAVTHYEKTNNARLRKQIITLLIEKRADRSIKNIKGETAEKLADYESDIKELFWLYDTKENIYEKNISGRIGFDYQEDLCALVLYRLIVTHGKYADFGLATEMTTAGKFDDVVFYTREGSRKSYTLIQAKAKATNKISYEQVANSKDTTFGLQKYLHSYHKMIKQNIFKVSKIKDLVICTNSDLVLHTFQENGIEVTESSNEVFNTGACYQFHIPDNRKQEIFSASYSIDLNKKEKKVKHQQIDEFLKKLIFVVKLSDIRNIIRKNETKDKEMYERFRVRISDWCKERFDCNKGKWITKEGLLKKEVSFQGKDIHLDEEAKEMVNAETLFKLFCEEKLEIGTLLPILGEVKEYYIERTLNHQIGIKKECLKESKNDIFVISDILEQELSQWIPDGEEWRKFEDFDKSQSIRFLTLNNQEPLEAQKQFEKFRQDDNIEKNIHWLKKEGNNLLWQKSKGSLSGIRKFVDEPTMEYNENNIEDIKDRIVIVVAEPGMGKSTIFSHLAERVKQSDPSLWVIKINLLDVLKQLQDLKFEDEDSKIKFFIDTSELKTDFEKKLFKNCLKRDKIVLFLDGFDEISPIYEEQVKNLVQKLEGNVKKIWISGRPYTRIYLEDAFGVLAYTLKPFSMKNQESFLKNFWKVKLWGEFCKEKKQSNPNFGTIHDKKYFEDNFEERYKSRGYKYSNDLLKLFSRSISDQEKKFTGIPLLIRMLAEVYQEKSEYIQEGFKEFYFSDKEEPDLSREKLNLVALYEAFVEKKFEIYLYDKVRTNCINPAAYDQAEKEKKRFFKNHKLLAMNLLYSEEQLKLLLPAEDIKKTQELIEKVKAIKERTGIIDNIIEGNKPHFIHKTFAEYFAANWFIDMFNKEKETAKNIFIFFLKYVLNEDDQVVCNFIESHLNENIIQKLKDLYDAEIMEILRTTYRRDKTLMHICMQFGYSRFTSVLIGIAGEIDKDNGNADGLKELLFAKGEYDGTPLHSAAKYGHKDIVELLFKHAQVIDQKNQNYNLLESILLVKAEYIGTALHSAAKHGHKDIVELLFKHAQEIDQKNQNYNLLESILLVRGELSGTPLHLAAEKGHKDTVELLFKHAQETDQKNQNYNILERILLATDGIGGTPLHSALRSRHKDTAELLFNHAQGINQKNQNSNLLKSILLTTDGYRGTPLHLATLNGHKDTVELFLKHAQEIDQKNQNYNLLERILLATHKCNEIPLHLAAESGHEDIAELLLKHAQEIDQKHQNSDLIKKILLTERWGKSALQLAINMNKENMVIVLLKYTEGVENEKLNVLKGLHTDEILFIFRYSIQLGMERCGFYEKAVEWWKKAAEQNYSNAQFALGMCYEMGQGVDQSYEEAIKWYTRAVKQRNRFGETCLKIMQDKMQGIVPPSDEETFSSYKVKSDSGQADVQYKLGFMYYSGRGVAQSYEEAVKLYTKASEQGHADAQFHLAVCYRNGEGVKRSFEEAVKWYTKAAEQGDAIAQCNLGYMYQNGFGVENSYEEAVKWYTKAAEQGHTKAQLILEDNMVLKSITELHKAESEECNTTPTEEESESEQSDFDLPLNDESELQSDAEVR